MDQAVIRWADRNIGRIICFLLTVVRRSIDAFRGGSAYREKASRIVFIKLVEQGSTVLAYSALKKAESLVGKENLFFLVFKENRPVIDLLDIVPASNVIEIDPMSAASLVTTSFNAILRMRGEKIDAAIDMEFFSRGSAILAYLSGAAKRVGLHLFTCEGPYRGDLFTHKLMYNPYLHAKVYFASLVEALLHKPPDANTPLHFDIPDPACETAAFTPSENETIACTEKIESLKRSPARKPVV
ncbi:MAG: hypothetical protein ABIJ27_07555, partial [Candidatus Omnitrophota bacterium]